MAVPEEVLDQTAVDLLDLVVPMEVVRRRSEIRRDLMLGETMISRQVEVRRSRADHHLLEVAPETRKKLKIGRTLSPKADGAKGRVGRGSGH